MMLTRPPVSSTPTATTMQGVLPQQGNVINKAVSYWTMLIFYKKLGPPIRSASLGLVLLTE